MPKDFKVYLDDIIESAAKIRSYIDSMSYEEFLNDDRTIDAVLRNLEIIGEATKRIPEKIRQQRSDIEWHKVIGLRNILIHQYSGVDLEIVWQIITQKLPVFEQQIKNILEST
ncbi:MAG: DUF86 domain-containing protein [Thermodesulfobacteriota bacterium]